MRDARLQALLAAHTGPFPRGLGGKEVEGVDLVMLDAEIAGIASHYARNSRSVTADHKIMLHELVEDLDRMWSELPSEEARAFFAESRGVALHILETR